MSQAPETVSIVIPVFNEAENIEELVQRISAIELGAAFRLLEIIVVDDGSIDESAAKAQACIAQEPRLRVVQLARNFGQTSALSAGFDHSRGDIIVCLDGDLQNDPKDISRLLARMSEGFDCVSGWRKDRKDEWLRTALSHVANRIIGRLTGLALHDYGCTLKAYRKRFVDRINLYGEMHRFIPVYLKTVGARICEMPVSHHARTRGVSKYGLNRTFKVVFDLMVIRFLNNYSNHPIYLFGTVGFVCLFAGFLSGAYSIWLKFSEHTAMIQTPLPLMCLISLFMGIHFILMGLLAELLIRIYHESQDKSTYLIKEVFEPRQDQA